MDEKNKLPEEQNIEEKKEQGTPAPESKIAHEPVSKTQIPKLPLIIGGIVAVVVIVGLIIAIALGGGKNNGDNSHNHTFEDWSVTKNATCTEEGVKTRYCNCGEKQTDVIPANGHAYINGECENCGNFKETSKCKHNNFDILVSKDATCTETGLTEGKRCSDCGEILLAQQETPVASHTYDDKYDESCNKCGFNRETECAHTTTEIIKGYAATCTQTGITDGTKCQKCGEILEQQTTIGKLGHVEVIDVAVAATCTTDGKTEGKHCSRCNQTLVAQTTIGKYGHYEIIDPAIPATCTTDGKSSGKHCGRCNYTLVAQTTIPASGHKYDDGVIISEATCLSQGIKQYTCTVTTCRHSYTENYSLPIYTATEISNQAIRYVGEITTYDKSGSALATGTGFVMSSDGKIITNYHVIEDAYSAQIIINDTFYTIASVLAYDANIDLAVLKVNSTGLTAATVCKNPVNVGETVYAIGSSRGLTNTFSQGIVTYADRVVDGVSHIQHDASITHGNSGGPLINVYGEVVGINTWGISDSQNLNFAVAADELDNLVYLSTPITLAQLYEQNNSAFDKLVNFILEYGEYDSTNNKVELSIENGYNSSYTQYHIVDFSYDIDGDYIDLTHYLAFVDSDNVTFFTGISMEKNVNSYYYAMFVSVDGTTTNKISGYIDYETFTDNTLLGYNSYEGSASQEALTRENASLSAIYLIENLEWLATNYLGLTVADFGFVSFSESQSDNGGNSGGNSYSQYQVELEALTIQYNADVAELQDKITDSQSKIENCQKAINNARSQLASLSSTCPQWFLQQYINNWRDYGSTANATAAAQNAWAKEYNNQRNQLNNTITINQTAISGHQTNINLYSTQIEVLTTQYLANVNALKAKYGIS